MYKRSVKKKVDRKGRFRTQPVTFMEIKVCIYKRSVKKKFDRKGRFRTQTVTFMEIKVRIYKRSVKKKVDRKGRFSHLHGDQGTHIQAVSEEEG